MIYILDKRCFKIDKGNAKAMIDGVPLNGEKVNQAIWCDVKSNPFPMLITLNRSPSKFIMSDVGSKLNSESFSIPLKYIAIADKEYFIKNSIELWKELCSNGIFNIWVPHAPFDRFEDAKTNPSKYRIVLVRIFEINEEFTSEDIIHASDRIDHIISENRDISIRRPIINDNEFFKIKNKLEKTISPYLQSVR